MRVWRFIMYDYLIVGSGLFGAVINSVLEQ